MTESYKGGLISLQNGVGVGPATSADELNPNSVYRQAHDGVIKQSGRVFEHFYDSTGTEVFRGAANFNPVKLEYKTGTPQTVFHTIP